MPLNISSRRCYARTQSHCLLETWIRPVFPPEFKCITVSLLNLDNTVNASGGHIQVFQARVLLFFNLNLFILIGGQLLYNIVLVLPYINMNLPQVYTCSPSWTPLPPPSLYHPSGSCTSPEHPVSCIEPGLAIHFLYDIIHISMQFSQIIPPSPSPTESKRLYYTSVSICCLAFRVIVTIFLNSIYMH